MLLLGHLCKNKPVNKRAHHHSDSASEDEPELVHDVTDEDEYLAVRQNAGKLYRQVIKFLSNESPASLRGLMAKASAF